MTVAVQPSLKPPHAVLLDLDGTLYNGEIKIPYAEQMIQRLRAASLPFLFLTNNSSRTPEMVAQHLTHLGIEASADEVFHSAQAAALYVTEDWHTRASTAQRPPLVYCLGEIGMQTALRLVGVQMYDDEAHQGIVPDYVVQGIDRQLTYEKLKTAVQHILAGATFILTNPDLLLPWNEQYVPGAGSIGALLEAATSVKPVVIGKPSPIIMRYALAYLNERHKAQADIQFSEVWMIGDNLRTDILAAQQTGSAGVLVLTGLANVDNVNRLIVETNVRPTAIFADLRTCTDAMLDNMLKTGGATDV